VRTFFYPESIMVVGVSETPTNLGRHIVENLDRFHFKGELYLVGKEGGSLNGRKIYARIEEIDASVDLVVFLIPAPFIPEALEVCGRKGIRYAVIESGGFSEFTDENMRLDEQVIEIAKRWHIRFVGPNCISIINLENGVVLPFVLLDPGVLATGPISFVAQSGGIVNSILRLCSNDNLGVNKFISMGNKLDLDENDYLEFLISDQGTKSIGLYLESVSNGRRLMDLAASSQKPVVVIKSNTNTTSNQIARFHTAALAGDDEVVSSALRRAGIHRVHTLQEMINAFKIFNLPLMKGPNLAILSRSGGSAVMAADSASRHGFGLPPFSEDFLQYVRKGARAGVIRMTNPLDLGDVFDLDFYREVMHRALQEKGIDGVLFSHAYLSGIDSMSTKYLIRAAKEFSHLYQKPVVLCMIPNFDEWFMMRRTTDFPIFTEPEDALKALGISLAYHNDRMARASHPRTRFDLSAPKAQDNERVSPRILGPAEALELLRQYEIPVPAYRLAKDHEEAVQAAELIGYPVALKTADSKVIHKTELGGVRLNIGDRHELKEALQGIPGDRFLVQRMVGAGHEVFIGGKDDPEFGPVILFGMGGIFVEALNDVVINVAPITERVAGEMIDGVQGSALLKGFRGGIKADLNALKECLVRVSRLLYEHGEIQQLDINPLVVLPEGRGCQAVDAKIFS
jgi:acyl-CoA synthetase (NDP forming)